MAGTGLGPRFIFVVEDSDDLRDLIVLWLTNRSEERRGG